MEFNGNQMRRLGVGLAPLLLAAIWSLWRFGFSQPTLIDLQKEMVRAQTAADTTRVIERLERFYLRKSIADTVRRKLEMDVQVLLDTTARELPNASGFDANKENVYQLESRLKRLVALAMVSKARGNDRDFRQMIRQVEDMAAQVDAGTGGNYWMPFAKRVRAVRKKGARNWLLAKRAAELCRRTIDTNFAESMQYASLALRKLREIPDKRLWLEVMQRLQYCQYEFESASDLSIGLGRRLAREAFDSGDALRSAGARFYLADAVYRSGQILAALLEFKSLLEMTKSYRSVPGIVRYEANVTRNIAACYWQLGQFHKALSILDAFGEYNLSARERVQLHSETALVHRRLGNFKLAEREYRRAIHLADSTRFFVNQTRIRLNFGAMLANLTEFDEARGYYDEAAAMMQRQPVGNSLQRIDHMLDLARMEYRMRNFDRFEELLAEAKQVVGRVGASPFLRVEMLRSMGEFYNQNEYYDLAAENFRKATAICEESGLQRIGIRSLLAYAGSLLQLRRHEEAEQALNEALATARKLGDRESVIDGLALQVENLAGKGSLDRAVAVSDALTAEIDDLSRQFERLGRLMAYRQKIYGYLKKSVIHELRNGREAAAFAKLDYAKAYAFKQRRQGAPAGMAGAVELADANELRRRLDPNSAVIDFVVCDSALCVFVLTDAGLQVLQKPLEIPALRSDVREYGAMIRETISLFQRDRTSAQRGRHFTNGNAIGSKIYKALFGWPELEAVIESAEKLYIVPDEFLFDLPFSTLPGSSSADDPRYLAERTSIIMLPSHSLVKIERRPAGQDAAPRAVLSVDCQLVGAAGCSDLLAGLSPFAKILSVEKAEFSKGDVIDALKQSMAALVIIGHGMANDSEPDKSYIEVTATSALSAESKKFRFTLSDFRKISWKKTELIVLAGCETGSGRLYRGSGNLSLLQGLISLGASNVLATQWKTDVRTTLPQCKSFLRAWRESRDPVRALNKVEVETIRSLRRNPYYERPYQYFWGGFQIASLNN